MGKIIAVLIILIILAAAAYGGFFILKDKVGDIRPAILPPKSVSTNSIASAGLPLDLPAGYTIGFFAQNVGDVRDLEFSPGGTLLASDTSGGKVIALINKNNKADQIKTVLTGLKNPHGIAFYGEKLFVAEETRLVRYNWDEQTLNATLDVVLFSIPPGGRHFTRSIVFDAQGRLFLSIGSTCDACNESNPWYASVVITDANGTNPQVFANGLRNSVFLALNPSSNQVWAPDMGRDNLGDDIPPDEINILLQGNNYGWPNCYGIQVPDRTFNPNTSCNSTQPPIYEIQAHSAPLGLVFIKSSQFPSDWQGDLLLAFHGSWNRSVPTGYKVVHMKVKGNQILGEENFISGFLQGSQTIGRPVDLAFDNQGYLYISDDKRGAIYIVGNR